MPSSATTDPLLAGVVAASLLGHRVVVTHGARGHPDGPCDLASVVVADRGERPFLIDHFTEGER